MLPICVVQLWPSHNQLSEPPRSKFTPARLNLLTALLSTLYFSSIDIKQLATAPVSAITKLARKQNQQMQITKAINSIFFAHGKSHSETARLRGDVRYFAGCTCRLTGSFML